MNEPTARNQSSPVAIVTGGGAGIGAAVARRLSEDGFAVVVADRDDTATKTTVSALANAVAVTADVSQAAGAAHVATTALEAYGRIDCLVNNAGIQRYGTVLDTDEAVWDEVMAVNVKSVYLTSRACLPALLRQPGATIVNLGSVQSLNAMPGAAAYVASKAAVLNLTRSMAVDFAPALRVNCVCPGSVDTPMLRTAAHEIADDPVAALDEWAAMHPLGRVASPDEVAQVVAFLAGPRSSFCTGAAFLVDGGMTATIR